MSKLFRTTGLFAAALLLVVTGLLAQGSGSMFTIDQGVGSVTLWPGGTLTIKTGADLTIEEGATVLCSATHAFDDPAAFSDTVEFSGATSVESGGALDIESGAAFEIAGTTVSSSAAELNVLDGVAAGLTAAELSTLDGITASVAELNITDGVTKTAAQINALAVGVAGGYKVARGVTALDGSNPTSPATGLTSIVACTVSLEGTAAPGVGTSVLTENMNGTSIDVYAWKVTATGDATLVASTGTENFHWICLGT